MSDQTAPTSPEPVRDELDRLRTDLEQAEARINDLLTRLDDRSAALNRTGASNDTLRAQLGRVQKLADEWAGDPVGGDLWRSDAVDDLRAALADQEPAK